MTFLDDVLKKLADQRFEARERVPVYQSERYFMSIDIYEKKSMEKVDFYPLSKWEYQEYKRSGR